MYLEKVLRLLFSIIAAPVIYYRSSSPMRSVYFAQESIRRSCMSKSMPDKRQHNIQQ
jgi:hypothetical protein